MPSQEVSADPALQRRVPQTDESFSIGSDVLKSILEFAVTQRIHKDTIESIKHLFNEFPNFIWRVGNYLNLLNIPEHSVAKTSTVREGHLLFKAK